jgi:hypothetical protein
MSKLQDLRATVIAAATTPAIEADQIFTFLRDGRITDTGAGLRYDATAIVIVTDWTGSAHPIARAMVQWLRTRENAERDALKFEVDLISHQAVDLNFELPFSEVIVFDGTEFAACAAAVPDPDQFLPP